MHTHTQSTLQERHNLLIDCGRLGDFNAWIGKEVCLMHGISNIAKQKKTINSTENGTMSNEGGGGGGGQVICTLVQFVCSKKSLVCKLFSSTNGD